MRLNLLIDEREPLTRGPGRRARNLRLGLERIGVPFEVCSSNYDLAVGLQNNIVFNVWRDLPAHTPIGPNVMHSAGDHKDIACKFNNYIVQSEWVKDYWLWQYPSPTDAFRFFIMPASVDTKEFTGEKQIDTNCLFYTKYQSGENKAAARHVYQTLGHSVVDIEYGKYTTDELRAACSHVEYCVFNSCCEKSSNALMEILACDVPVYVIDSIRWIGDDKFDRCTSAPHFSDECGVKGDLTGKGFVEFYDNVVSGRYRPRAFVNNGFTVEQVANTLVGIVEACHE